MRNCEYKNCTKKGEVYLETVNIHLCREHFNKVRKILIRDLKKIRESEKNVGKGSKKV